MRNNKRCRQFNRELADWQKLSNHAGADVARAKVIEQLVAVVFWLDSTNGPRQASRLFQTIADQLIEDEGAGAEGAAALIRGA
jgi:hypothetical protein